jgi:hypothetical protein
MFARWRSGGSAKVRQATTGAVLRIAAAQVHDRMTPVSDDRWWTTVRKITPRRSRVCPVS